MGRFGRDNRQTEHEYVEERLSPYLDGELLPEERTIVQNHLLSCEECQWSLETLRQTVQWTRELPSVPVPRMFTLPVPAEPVRAPRWRWSVPVFQAATALVAVLLLFVVAGDLMFTSRMPVSEVPVAMLEKEVVDVQMVEVTVESEAIPVGDEAPPAGVEEPLAAEAVEEAPLDPAADTEPPPAPPTSAPQKTLATEPARIAAEVVSTPTAESSTMGGPGLDSSPEPAEAKEAIAETEASKPPPTTASAAGGAETETAAEGEGIEPSPTPVPLPTIAPTVTALQPTRIAVAPEADVKDSEGEAMEEDALAGQETTGTWQQPLEPWLSAAEIALALLLVFLLAITIVLMVQKRRTS